MLTDYCAYAQMLKHNAQMLTVISDNHSGFLKEVVLKHCT